MIAAVNQHVANASDALLAESCDRERHRRYPASHRSRSGYTSNFDQARAGFEAAWKDYLPRCTEADFLEYRRQRAWTAWKYAMYDAGLPVPTQSSNGRARCFCGATIDIAGTYPHVREAHMTDLRHA
jgi:hypothetical protein